MPAARPGQAGQQPERPVMHRRIRGRAGCAGSPALSVLAGPSQSQEAEDLVLKCDRAAGLALRVHLDSLERVSAAGRLRLQVGGA